MHRLRTANGTRGCDARPCSRIQRTVGRLADVCNSPPSIHNVAAEKVLLTRENCLAVVVILLPRRLAEQQAKARPGLDRQIWFWRPRVCVETRGSALKVAIHVDIHGQQALFLLVAHEIRVAVPSELVARMILREAPTLVQPYGLPLLSIQLQRRRHKWLQPRPHRGRKAGVRGDEPEVASIFLHVVCGSEAMLLRC